VDCTAFVDCTDIAGDEPPKRKARTPAVKKRKGKG
jgi:hypothetical protein